MRQASDAIKMGSTDAATQETALRSVMSYLVNELWDKSTPELATNVHRIIKKVTNNADPYKKLKERYNLAALKLYPKLESTVKNSKDHLSCATKIAIMGNIIDFGPKTDINLEKEIEELLYQDLAINDIDKLKMALRESKKVLYLADNAGETVFDRPLIEELVKQNEVIYAVKDAPILNDATFQDAEIAGITRLLQLNRLVLIVREYCLESVHQNFSRILKIAG
jgi:uncharacterized protein with ATP-grasp and redox domains